MKFNALSIVQPAGMKIATGQKTLEIRSWKPPVVPLRNLVVVENQRRLEGEGEFDPDGVAVALVDIVAVRDWTEEDARRDGQTFVAGYFAWVIAKVRPLEMKMRLPAKRMIYEVEIPPV